jgi:hypothetical protein
MDGIRCAISCDETGRIALCDERIESTLVLIDPSFKKVSSLAIPPKTNSIAWRGEKIILLAKDRGEFLHELDVKNGNILSRGIPGQDENSLVAPSSIPKTDKQLVVTKDGVYIFRNKVLEVIEYLSPDLKFQTRYCGKSYLKKICLYQRSFSHEKLNVNINLGYPPLDSSATAMLSLHGGCIALLSNRKFKMGATSGMWVVEKFSPGLNFLSAMGLPVDAKILDCIFQQTGSFVFGTANGEIWIVSPEEFVEINNIEYRKSRKAHDNVLRSQSFGLGEFTPPIIIQKSIDRLQEILSKGQGRDHFIIKGTVDAKGRFFMDRILGNGCISLAEQKRISSISFKPGNKLGKPTCCKVSITCYFSKLAKDLVSRI